MSKAPRIDWYPSDWIAATRHLSPEERAVYHDLLMMIYEAHGALKEDPRRISRVIGITTKRLERIVSLLIDEGKLCRIDGFLTNDRAENELEKRENRSEKARASAKSRWAKERRKGKQNQHKPDADAMRSQCSGDAHQRPTVEKEKATPSPKRGTRLPADWFLPREWGEWALGEGMDHETIRREADKFRDHFHSTTRNATKLDWLKAWRNWCRTAMERRPQQRSSSRGQDRFDRRMEFARSLEERQAAEPDVADGSGDGSVVTLLPARHIG